MPARNLLDPRWHWLRATLERMYAELTPDESMLSLALSTVTDDGTAVIVTAVDSDGELTRKLMNDAGVFEDALRLAEDPRNFDLVPEVDHGVA